MSDLLGQTIGDHRLEAILGRGAAGPVYRARHVRLDRPAAVRVLDERLTAAPGFRAAFLPLARAAAALRHPQIAEIYDVGEDGALCYIVTELLTGGSLRDLIRQSPGTPPPLDQSVELLRQAAEGVGAAHARGLTHGDLRPETILRAADGSAKVTDFAIERLLAAAGISAGRPAYLSPEQCRGAVPDPRSDVYTLGVVLYELLTGYVPFGVSTIAEALEKHGSTQPTPPRVVRPQIPAALEAVVLRCLAKDPAARYQQGAELAAALRAAPRAVPAAPPAAAQKTVLLPETAAAQPTTAAPRITPPQGNAGAGPVVQLLDAAGAVIRSVPLSQAGVRVGRGFENTLALEDDQLSRDHLLIGWDGETATLTDLGSTNGTILRGARIPTQTPVRWPPGQIVAIGRSQLRLLLPGAPTMAAAPTTVSATPTRSVPAASQTTPPPLNPARPTVRGGENGLIVRLDQEQLALEPGRPTLLGVTVLNQGSRPDSVTLSIEGVSGIWLRGGSGALQVPAGGQASATLTIQPPRSPDVAAGDYPVIVRARSGTNQAESGTARGRWSVLPYLEATLSLRPRAVEGVGEAETVATLTHNGNGSALYQIGADDPREELGYDISPEEVTLAPGESAQISVIVQAARRLLGSPQPYSFEVMAYADNGPPAASAQGRLTSHPSLPGWAATLLALGALGLIGIAVWWSGILTPPAAIVQPTPLATLAPLATLTPTPPPSATPTQEPGAPVIEIFEVRPPVTQPGGTVIIRWQITNADQRTIDPLGDVEPSGERQFVVDQTTTFKLTAIGGGKTVTRGIQAVVQVPTAEPTAPPTAAPSATRAAPTAVPATAAPTAAPATANPTAPATIAASAVAPTAGPLFLQDTAASAVWRTETGPLTFGSPTDANRPQGGYAELVTNPQLEGGFGATSGLLLAPRAQVENFVSGEWTVPAIRSGQRLRARVGFPLLPAGTSSTARVRIELTLSGEPLLLREKTADGQPIDIDLDLARVVGRSGQLALRIVSLDPQAAQGVYVVGLRVEG